MRVARTGEDFVVIDGDVSPSHSSLPSRVPVIVHGLEPPAHVLPDEIPRGGVERLDAAQAGDIHHAVVDERRDLVRAGRSRPRPDQLQTADAVAVDLVEWAVPPSVQRPARHCQVEGAGGTVGE